MESLVGELAATSLLQDVSAEVIAGLLDHAAPMALAPGDILLSPQRDNRHVYLLLSGSLSLRFGSPESTEIRKLAPGVSVGELSVLDNKPPSAYVVADEACRVFPIHRDVLLKLVADGNPIVRNLLRLLSQWLHANTLRILEDREQILQLTDRANLDGLTGLYNRRWLEETLPRLVSQGSRGDLPLCILLIDVDRFKAYNDTQGHQAGDCALVAMGEVLKTTLRPYDFAARYGGEEFLVILQNTGEDEGLAVAERIRKAAQAKPIAGPDGTPLPSVTVSIGLATSRCHSSREALVAAADQQLYRAKAEGRNRACAESNALPASDG